MARKAAHVWGELASLHALVELLPEAGMVVDGDGRLVLANQRLAVLFGYRASELPGRPAESLVSGIVHSGQPVAFATEGRGELTTIQAGRRCDGAEFPVLVSLSHVRTSRGVMTLGLVRDLSDLLRELEAARDRFVSHAAHELRTPLATLAGLAGLLEARRGDMSPAQVDRALASIHRQSRRASVLVTNLFDLSQAGLGFLPVLEETVRLDQVVAEALEVAPPPAAKAVDVLMPAGILVVADLLRLEQAVANLLINAYRYGGHRITVHCAIPSDGFAVLTIADDGDGVPDQIRARLFDPFMRGPKAVKAGGLGIGLALSRRIVEAIGGSLTYEPGEPRGSRFVVRLRVAPDG